MEDEELKSEESNEVDNSEELKSETNNENEALSNALQTIDELQKTIESLTKSNEQLQKDLDDCHSVFMGTGRKSEEKDNSYQSKIKEIQ